MTHLPSRSLISPDIASSRSLISTSMSSLLTPGRPSSITYAPSVSEMSACAIQGISAVVAPGPAVDSSSRPVKQIVKLGQRVARPCGDPALRQGADSPSACG